MTTTLRNNFVKMGIEVTKSKAVLTLTLPLTENEGFSPEFIYERARLRALSS
jgi:hypothetical protein